jgi:hypothetical protein
MVRPVPFAAFGSLPSEDVAVGGGVLALADSGEFGTSGEHEAANMSANVKKTARRPNFLWCPRMSLWLPNLDDFRSVRATPFGPKCQSESQTKELSSCGDHKTLWLNLQNRNPSFARRRVMARGRTQSIDHAAKAPGAKQQVPAGTRIIVTAEMGSTRQSSHRSDRRRRYAQCQSRWSR